MKLRSQVPAALHADQQSRRMFLKSSAGLTLAIPFLPSLLTAYSEKAFADSTPPLRYVHLLTPNGGLQHKNWFGSNLPTTPLQLYSDHTARVGQLSSLAASGGLSRTFTSTFNDLLPYSNVIAGADQPYYFGHGTGHQFGTFAICNPGMEAPYAGPVFDSTNIDIETMSIDQVLANAGTNGIYRGGLGSRRRSLNFGNNSTSWTRDVYGTKDPVVAHSHMGWGSLGGVYTYLFGAVPAGANGQTSSNVILNLVNSFWPAGKKLMQVLSAADRYTLERFFQLAQDVSTNYVAPPANLNLTMPADAVNAYPISGAGYGALADMISMAFQADVTRVVTLHMDSAAELASLDWHANSHATVGNDAAQDTLVSLHNFIAEKFLARLGHDLLSTADPLNNSNSLLHNSLVYWAHENKAPHHNYSSPTFLMGAAGGRIQTNVFADLRKSTSAADQFGVDSVNDPLIQGDIHNRLFASVFYAMNIPRTQYEISRGGTSLTYPLTKGYGHAMVSPTQSWASFPTYNLSRIGEPWEFLTKTSTTWG